MNICDAIHLRARQVPEKIAILEGENSLCYRDLSTQINQVAGVLSAHGVSPGSLVGINSRESTKHVVTKLGILQAGAAAFTLDWRSRSDSTRLINYLPPGTLILSEPGRLSSDGVNIVFMDEEWDARVAAIKDAPNRYIDGESPAMVTLSSGSTGEPKAMVTTHREQYWRYLQKDIYLPRSSSDVYLSALPFSFAASNNQVFYNLMSGATVVLYPVLFSISELVEEINRRGVTTLLFVPTIVERMVTEACTRGPLLPGVSKLVVGGAPISPFTKQRCMETVTPNLYDVYASSGAGWIAIAYPEDATTHPGSVGRCIGTSEVQVVDEDHNPLSCGHSGRIRCRGDTVTHGFYPGFPQSDKNEIYKDGFYYPGDIGHFDQQGYLYLDGRANSLIIRGGVNIFPEQIENVLVNHVEVDAVAVCGIPSREFGEEVVAIIAGGHAPDGKEMMEYSRRNLGPHLCPRHFVFVKKLPLGRTGKLARAELPRLAQDLLSLQGQQQESG